MDTSFRPLLASLGTIFPFQGPFRLSDYFPTLGIFAQTGPPVIESCNWLSGDVYSGISSEGPKLRSGIRPSRCSMPSNNLIKSVNYFKLLKIFGLFFSCKSLHGHIPPACIVISGLVTKDRAHVLGRASSWRALLPSIPVFISDNCHGLYIIER